MGQPSDTIDDVPKKGEFENGNDDTNLPTYKGDEIDTEQVKPKRSLPIRILHSFRRREDHVRLNTLGQQVVDEGKLPAGVDPTEISHDTSRLDRKLKGRHMQMIAIGGAIGTGLFIGSGSALATGGPLALVIGFGIIGIMLFFVIHALGELAVMFPIAGISQTRSISDDRCFLSLFNSVHRSCLGILHGMELCHAMASCPST
jgi:Amino acid permease